MQGGPKGPKVAQRVQQRPEGLQASVGAQQGPRLLISYIRTYLIFVTNITNGICGENSDGAISEKYGKILNLSTIIMRRNVSTC